ncbi:hypothetical protein JOC54_004478 [Alkalihalobacillus xiaoxiensis]|uniref:Polysaccharide pyruvyl transferase domain-containing protein n=1 Tax=Shouchella xiaoxiensis TaxID=766895 RepID=A0ABS2T065_9BACI|nr:polysaccharide pyruvyl transferase family protein [Shouchella xiaoxiensis]MBM7841177.1 hypothetical protein [Shouchella xiaoxiensis]
MKKILIRSGISPLESFKPTEILFNNSIGGNVGNLIYAYSIYRTLTTENTTIVPDYYKIEPENAEFINTNYDAYVIPLADAFREQFIPQLKKYTSLINKLTIPVYVIGVGLRASFEPNLDKGFPFDDAVREFVKAVLKKSSIIGVRGEITAKYLSKLGFKEGVDHTVIGCPSMYTFGRELQIRDTNISRESKIAVNSSMLSPDNVLSFISRTMEEYPDHYFIPQWMKEMTLVYTGTGKLKDNDNYPTKMSDEVYMRGRVPFFLNAKTWIDFLKDVDLSFGARLHGNITATIAGTPSILLPKDARMRELAEYHQLTYVFANELTENTRLEDLIDRVDFHAPEKVQGKNFDKFIDFLDNNGIDHIYKNKNTGLAYTAPLDIKMANVEQLKPIYPITACSSEEIVQRFEDYFPLAEKRAEQKEIKLKNKLKESNEKLNKAEKVIKKQQKTLQRRSVKVALKATDLIRRNK